MSIGEWRFTDVEEGHVGNRSDQGPEIHSDRVVVKMDKKFELPKHSSSRNLSPYSEINSLIFYRSKCNISNQCIDIQINKIMTKNH